MSEVVEESRNSTNLNQLLIWVSTSNQAGGFSTKFHASDAILQAVMRRA